jgi:CHAT domain-containing protein/tetratricopeptide (TPR) repeat protein
MYMTSVEKIVALLSAPGKVIDPEERASLCRCALALISSPSAPRQWAFLQSELGINLVKQETGDVGANIESAIAAFEGALQIRQRSLTPIDWARTTMNLANAYMKRMKGNLAENQELAIAAFTDVLTVVGRSAMPSQWALVTKNLGTAYMERIRGSRSENLTQAIELFKAALEVIPSHSALEPWTKAKQALARAYSLLSTLQGRDAELSNNANAVYAEILALKRRLPPALYVDVLLEQVSALLDSPAEVLPHALDGALASCNEVLASGAGNLPGPIRIRALELKSTAIKTRVVKAREGNLDAAIEALDQALTIARDRNLLSCVPRLMVRRAVLFCERLDGTRANNLEVAIESLESVLEQLIGKESTVEHAEACVNLGNAYNERVYGGRAENQEKAITCYQMALTVYRRDYWPQYWSATLTNLGSVYQERIRGLRRDNARESVVCLLSALEFRTRERDSLDWAKTMLALGNSYMMGEDESAIDDAISTLRQAAHVTSQKSDANLWFTVHVNLATAYSRKHVDQGDNIDKAIGIYDHLLSETSRDKAPLDWALLMFNSGNAYRSRITGERRVNEEAAIRRYLAALEVYQVRSTPSFYLKVQKNLGDIHFSHQRWSPASDAYRAVLAASEILYGAAATLEARVAELRDVHMIASRLAYSLVRQGQFSDAVVAIERGRARAVAESLALNEIPLGDITECDRNKFEEVATEIEQLQREALLPEGAAGRRGFLQLSRLLGEKYAEHQAIVRQIQAYVPSFLPTVTLESIQQAALSTAPIVYVVPTEQGGVALFVFATREPMAVWLDDLTTDLVRQSVGTFLSSSMRWVSDQTNESARVAWFKTLDSITNSLWNYGVGILVETLGGFEAVTVVPCGLLGLLPLHCAWVENVSCLCGRRYASDAITFSYAPSARSLSSARLRAQTISASTVLCIDEPRPVSLPKLPNSALETAVVTQRFPDSRTLAGSEASQLAVATRLPHYGVVHFSCHGYADVDSPLRSGLVMAHDALLTLREFLNLRLGTLRLAFLSACETAKVGTGLPDEAIGLPTGLVQSGAAGVIATLWPVADISALMIAAVFYRTWLEEGTTPAEALNRAQRWVRDSTNEEKRVVLQSMMHEATMSDAALDAKIKLFHQLDDLKHDALTFSHPFYWGAFLHVGA